MPRTARIAPGDWIFHVLNRRCGPGPLFESPLCYARFLEEVAEAAKVDDMRILAYCLMPNHWHMLLWPRRDGDLGRFIQRLSVRHVMRWHRAHESTGRGHLYQARYKSFPVSNDGHLLTVYAYIERNPLRAGLVQRAEHWPWSSAAVRTDVAADSPARGQGSLIELASSPVPLPRDWLKRLNGHEGTRELEATRQALLHDLPFGDDEWKKRAADRLALRSEPGQRGRRRSSG